MTRPLISAGLVIALCAPAAAETAPGHGADASVTIVVSCFRGPMRAVVWDRPTTAFVDSLVAAGYDYTEATAIGTRLCRDEALLDDSDAMKAEMRRIYTATR